MSAPEEGRGPVGTDVTTGAALYAGDGEVSVVHAENEAQAESAASKNKRDTHLLMLIRRAKCCRLVKRTHGDGHRIDFFGLRGRDLRGFSGTTEDLIRSFMAAKKF